MAKIPTRKRSDAHEKRVADLFGASINPNSGAVANLALKGDCRNPDLLIECKCTEGKSLSLSLEVFQKAERQAIAIGKEPLLDFEFQGLSPNEVFGAYTIADRNYFVEMLENSNNYKNITKVLTAKELITKLRPLLKPDIRNEIALALRLCAELGSLRYELGDLL